MPIRPEFRHLYGAEWKKIRQRILERAGGACERCGKPDAQIVFTYTWQTWRMTDRVRPISQLCEIGYYAREKVYHMVWIPETGRFWRDQQGERITQCVWPSSGLPRRVRVVITVAHLDHNPANMSGENLEALCQWCHLRHDLGQHAESRAGRRDRRRPLLAAFKQVL